MHGADEAATPYTRRQAVHVRGRLVLSLAVCAILTPLGAPAAQGHVHPQHAWVVVPLELASASSRTYWLGEGVAVLVADELERRGVAVVSREARVGALDELRLPSSVTLSRATYVRVGELLGASAVVFGRITTDETSLTLSARRLELESGVLGPEVVEEGKLVDLFALSRRLASRLAGGEPAGGAEVPPPPLDAFEAYVKAVLTDRPEARVRLLEAALARAPSYDRLRLALWDARSDLGDHAEALLALEGIVDASPLARVARFDAALSLIELKRYDEAFEALRALGDARPDAAVMSNLGVVQLRRGSTPQTGLPTYYFNRAVELEPDDADLFFNLGYAYWEQGEPQAAIYWLRESLRRNPADADAHFVLAAALDRTGGTLEAGRERTLAQHLSSRYVHVSKPAAGDAVPKGLERLKDSLSPLYPMRFDAALTAAAQRNQEELVAFHLERGTRLYEQRRDGDAEPELRRVLFLSPYHAEAHLLVGRIYMRSGRVREAIAAFRISLWSEETAAAHLALAEALLETRDRAGARTEVQRALAMDPQSPDARALLAHLDATTVR
jgi:tetratricopeptide (TPR) repeat protein